MRKSIWVVIDEDYHHDFLVTCYHFGKTPTFPNHFLQSGRSYSIELAWDVKIIGGIGRFFKCLIKSYTWRDRAN